MDKNQSPSVLESQNMTSGSWPNFSKKKQRNYIYGREDYATVTTTESHERSNEFHTALSKYERDQELKHGKSLPATWQQQKKKKRQFRSPLISSEEEDDQGDEERKKDRSRIDTSTSLKKNNSAIEEFKGIDPEIAERVLNEILDMKLNVHWNDISGLDDVKQVLHEMIILPSMHPEMFRGLRTPPRGLLLFGPPGNGKTMIAKAIATEAKMTFFSISASVLCSKWIGEGEKTMRALFTIARAKAPAFVFIDEIDSILCARSSEENESSRRLKNEFLLQFDGATTSSEDAVIVMGATNRPFDLDDAARRRLPKRIYVPLPEEKTRSKLLRNLLHNEKHCLTEEQIEKIAQHLEGYSCSDIHQISQHAAMGPVRDIMKAGTGKILGELRPICYEDFLKAISMNRPSVALEECKLYEEFAEKFGTKGF
ncbi:fidgetin-like protein 1 isoform X2 [Schistocerca gregaria]|nr:fidgetin-like protein 1 isoform X2 [Schistocerca gregaria]